MPVCLERFSGNPLVLSDGDALPGGELFRLHAEGDNFEICLENLEGQKLRFGINEKNELFLDRKNAGTEDFSGIYKKDIFSVREVNRFFSGSCELDAVFDVNSMELYADGGTRNMSSVVYPDSPYVRIGISGAVRVNAYTFSP